MQDVLSSREEKHLWLALLARQKRTKQKLDDIDSFNGLGLPVWIHLRIFGEARVIESVYRKTLFIHAIEQKIFLNRIQANGSPDCLPGKTRLTITNFALDLVTPRNEDQSRIQIESTPFHGPSENDGPVVGPQSNSGASVRRRNETGGGDYGNTKFE